MNVKKHTRSFAGGEITPELYGRLDLTKNQTGLKGALNFWTLPHGPVQNRSGFEYVIHAKHPDKDAVLLEFEYNTEQTFAIEFGDQYIRWHTNGGTLLETGLTVTGITKASVGVLTYTGTDPSNGDWMYLSNLGGMTELNGRYVKVANVDGGANTFELQDVLGNNINTTNYTAYTSGGTAARVYEIASTYTEDELFDLHVTQSADVFTIVHPNHAPAELRRLGATNWTLTDIAFEPTIDPPAAPTTTGGGPGGGTPYDNTYVCTAIAAEGLEESLASASDTESRDLTVAGNYIDVDPPAVTGAVRYNIYKLKNGLYGYIGQTDGSALRDNNITPDMTKTPAISDTPFGSSSNYPGAVGYYSGRRHFAGIDTKPQNYWATRSGTESNLAYSIPTRDDDRIAFRIVANQTNRIRHIVPLTSLVLLTSGGGWVVAPQNSDILTPDSAEPKPIDAEGASNTRPVIAGKNLLYVADQGSRVREMKPGQYTANDYSTTDISIMAPHLFDGYTLTDSAYVRAPHKMCFFTRDDGMLLGLTYLPEHDVVAWHRHRHSNGDGEFVSVAAVREGKESALYAVVKRTIDGQEVRYIERQRARRFATQSDWFFVDSGVTVENPSSLTIQNGLWHLEGEEVQVLVDGTVHPVRTVTNGAITLDLDELPDKVQIGSYIGADVELLPPAIEADSAFGQGMVKNVLAVYLRVLESSGIKAGPDADHLREYAQRTNEAYGAAPRAVSKSIKITIDGNWAEDAPVFIRQANPLPLTIASATIEATLGG